MGTQCENGLIFILYPTVQENILKSKPICFKYSNILLRIAGVTGED
tara:strand:+ start:7726 stop:7863 length:138 start_codon:yes stop_codon:yes gene_type:complete